MPLKDDGFKIRGSAHKLKIALKVKVVLTCINERVLTASVTSNIKMHAPISGASRKPGGGIIHGQPRNK
jgi:hypothetical protein